MSYLAIKHLHITCAILSGFGFCLRGFWMLNGSALLQARWVKVVPHVVDSALLGSALSMVYLSSQYPFVQPWLTAKVFGLLTYILLGMVALKRGRTQRIRGAFFVLALLAFGYIAGVALSRNPLIYGVW
ncbi:MAG: Invasion expression up-regulator, SirB [Rhodocyclaceae bacterium]|nr:Invasion expression up-regulator, SirB [Rhodocyclaceae bacterium]